MSEKNEEFMAKCKTLTVEQLEHLLKKGGLTKEQELICKTEINTILDRKKYNTNEEGAPEIISKAQPAITKQESETINSDYKASTGPENINNTTRAEGKMTVNTQYKVSRTILAIVAFFSWASVIVGVILLLVALGMFISAEGIERLAVGPTAGGGIGLTLFGLVTVMLSQSTRATLDSADYARETLAIAKQQAKPAAS